MRSISPRSLEMIARKLGTEPIIVLSIQWGKGGPVKYYADRGFILDDEGEGGIIIEGRVLQVSDLENVVKVSDSGTSQNISVLLDDTDGEMKEIINRIDIHKRTVNVLQWFTGIPFEEAFVIFQGQISSPIVWKESERTLSFEVVQEVENGDVGFSPEEGQFAYIPPEHVGHAWPLGFGSNVRVKGLQLNDTPTGITRNAIGFEDTNLERKISQNSVKSKDLRALAYMSMLFAGQAAHSAFVMKEEVRLLEAALQVGSNLDMLREQMQEALNSQGPELTFSRGFIDGGEGESDSWETGGDTGTYFSTTYSLGGEGSASNPTNMLDSLAGSDTIDESAISSAISSLNSQISQMQGIQKQYEDQAAQLLAQATEVSNDNSNLFENLQTQRNLGQSPSVIDGHKFPTGLITVKIGEAILDGYFTGDQFTSTGEPRFPQDVDYTPQGENLESGVFHDEELEKKPFLVIQPGSTVKLYSNFPIYYMINILESSVEQVFAKKSGTGGGAAKLVPVPQDYYSVQDFSFKTTGVDPIEYTGTIVKLNKALSCYDEGWEDDIYVNFTSSVGPNTIDIMIWLIETYSDKTWDADTFNYVRAKLAQYPSHFVLEDRRNVLTLLSELAFQARLAIWLASGKFFVRYLPEEPATIDVITDDDIGPESIEIEHSRTEEIVTKMVAEWKGRHDYDKPNRMVVKYNVHKYNVQEQTYDFFAYNSPDVIKKALTYWIIHKGNTWKKFKCNVFLNKLKLEPYDVVRLSLTRDHVANVDEVLKCVVESAQYDSEKQTIALELWVPVRLGEMKVYDLAYPGRVDTYVYFPTQQEEVDGAVDTIDHNNPTNPYGNSIPGVNISVDNSAQRMPDLHTYAIPQSAGFRNISDKHATPLFYGRDQEGAVADGTAPGPYTVTLDQNPNASQINVGDQISVGRNPPITVTGITNAPAPTPLGVRSTVTLAQPLTTPAAPGDVVRKGAISAIDPPVSTSQPYRFRGYRPTIAGEAAPAPELAELSGDGGNVPIKIEGHLGGKVYAATAYPRGINKGGIDISVTILQISSEDEIPEGTWLIGINAGGNYYAQPPVFM